MSDGCFYRQKSKQQEVNCKGLSGPKIPKEEKAFQDAFKKALHKPSTKAVNALISALAAYPSDWQGFWLCGLYHDQGFDGAPADPSKAQEYFLKAEAAVKGTPHENWLNTFLLWYNRDAGNFLKPLDAEQKKLRRMGVAMCQSYLTGSKALSSVYEEYGSDNYEMAGILMYAGNIEADPFYDFLTIPTFSHDEQVKHTNRFYEKVDESIDAYAACIKARNSGKTPCWDQMQDMYYYLLGLNSIDSGDLLTGELAASAGTSEAAYGIAAYIHAAEMGCQPAIHELVRLANASQDNFDLIERVYRTTSHISSDPFELFLLDCLKQCVEKADEEAMRLFQMYYAERFAGKN